MQVNREVNMVLNERLGKLEDKLEEKQTLDSHQTNRTAHQRHKRSASVTPNQSARPTLTGVSNRLKALELRYLSHCFD